MGARWSEWLQAWWIPETDEKLLAKATERGYLTPPEARVHFDVGFEKGRGVFHTDTKTWSFGESETMAIEKMKAKGFFARDSQNKSE